MGQEILCAPKLSSPSLGLIQLDTQSVRGAGVTRPGREAGVVKNDWSDTSTPSYPFVACAGGHRY